MLLCSKNSTVVVSNKWNAVKKRLHRIMGNMLMLPQLKRWVGMNVRFCAAQAHSSPTGDDHNAHGIKWNKSMSATSIVSAKWNAPYVDEIDIIEEKIAVD